MNNTEFEIRYTSQDGITSSVPLRARPLVFGSATDNDIRLESQFASRNHFQVQLDAGRVFVSDLKSRNGTFLNGRRLIPYTREEWHPGDTLSIPKMHFELISKGVPRSTSTAAPEQFKFVADRSTIPASENVTLTLSYSGQQPQYPVTFEARTFDPGLEAIIDPPGAVITNQSTIQVRGQVRPRKRYWFGGEYPVRFAAMTPKGLFDSVEVMVKLRPRYEALLLLLPLFMGCAAVIAVAAGLFQPVQPTLEPPTLTPQPTAIIATPFIAPSAPPLPTETIIPTIPGCVNQCSALGWQNYIVQHGDTLSSLAVSVGETASHVAEVNCLSDINRIVTGQAICFPRQPQHPDLTISVVRSGVVDVGSPYPLFADFTVTVTNNGPGRAFGQVHLTSIDDGNIIGSASGAGWTCSVAADLATIDCTHPGSLAPGASLPGIAVAHNFGVNFTVQVTTSFETNTNNNAATGSGCNDPSSSRPGFPIHNCSDHDLWQQRCLANPNSDKDLHIPEAVGACAQWRSLSG